MSKGKHFLRTARKQANLTLEEASGRLARRGISLSPGQLSRLEREESDVTQERLQQLGRLYDWTPGELLSGKGEASSTARDVDEGPVMVPVRSYVGAGDEIISLDDDEEPIDWIEAPPGLEDAEATQVRGASMQPLYRDGDYLFHKRMQLDPLQLRDEVAVMQTRSRKRYVKMVQPGTKRGTFRLVSFNPLFPPIEDQVLTWVSPILAMRRGRWMPKRR